MTDTPGIVVDNLTKRYENLVAVDDLNLVIPRGECFAFLGHNGAGKTTTIKMLTGLVRPTAGRAVIAGFDIQTNPVEAKRRIGYIPDHPYLYEKLSGREFCHFVGSLFGMEQGVQDERMEEAFARFGLTACADRLIESYSHGMRQKLVITASLLHRPEIVIVDEPMVGLDPQSARIVKDLFRQLAREGRTIFLSTHTLSLAEDVADRIGIIRSGRVIFLGTLDELRARTNRGDADLEELFLMLNEEEA